MKKLLLIVLVLFGLQTQAQVYFCDSIGYTIHTTQSSPTATILILNGVSNIPGVVTDWDWQVCDANLCYSASGQSVTFNQFSITDTIEVCLTTILDINMTVYTCIQCDSLVYGSGGWMKMGVLTSIEEVEISIIKDNKMYDLLGREIFKIPIGEIYIKNRNKLITK